jgi:uncharacterized protein YfiM (DUF2279 family)
MLNINIHYDGDQEKFLRSAKKKSGLTWPEFILFTAGYTEKYIEE